MAVGREVQAARGTLPALPQSGGGAEPGRVPQDGCRASWGGDGALNGSLWGWKATIEQSH